MPRQPSLGRVGDRFGWRIHPISGIRRFHFGDDTLGDGNYAPATGTVVYAGWDYTGHGFGYVVGIREDADPRVEWWVAHHASLRVSRGDRTAEGVTYLGPKGSTGASTGPHAHTERRVGGNGTPGSGTATDPRIHYTKLATAPSIPKEDDMPRLIRNHDGSIGLVSDAGELQPIGSIDEVRALQASGLVGDWVQMPDGLVWELLTVRTARLRAAAADVDETAIARELTPMLVSPILDAVAELDDVQLDEEQLQRVTEAALRRVFADAAQV